METDLELITKSIQKKLGKETSSKIADDIASIVTIKTNYEKQDKAYKDEIQTLKDDKEMLIQANGNLLQKISMANDEELEPKKKEKEDKTPAKDFNFRAVFDEKGNFLK